MEEFCLRCEVQKVRASTKARTYATIDQKCFITARVRSTTESNALTCVYLSVQKGGRGEYLPWTREGGLSTVHGVPALDGGGDIYLGWGRGGGKLPWTGSTPSQGGGTPGRMGYSHQEWMGVPPQSYWMGVSTCRGAIDNKGCLFFAVDVVY